MHIRALPYSLAAALFCVACTFDQTGIEGALGGLDATLGSSSPDAALGAVDAGIAEIDAAPGTSDAPPAAADSGSEDADDEAFGVACGETTCNPPEVCCVTGWSLGDDEEAECTAPEDCASRDSVTCDGPEDCPIPDEVCCRPSVLEAATTCEPASSCFVPACRADDDCPDANSECCGADYGAGYCSTLGCL
jgi:hypothetical protein